VYPSSTKCLSQLVLFLLCFPCSHQSRLGFHFSISSIVWNPWDFSQLRVASCCFDYSNGRYHNYSESHLSLGQSEETSDEGSEDSASRLANCYSNLVSWEIWIGFRHPASLTQIWRLAPSSADTTSSLEFVFLESDSHSLCPGSSTFLAIYSLKSRPLLAAPFSASPLDHHKIFSSSSFRSSSTSSGHSWVPRQSYSNDSTSFASVQPVDSAPLLYFKVQSENSSYSHCWAYLSSLPNDIWYLSYHSLIPSISTCFSHN
jgi:hypothetical protein